MMAVLIAMGFLLALGLAVRTRETGPALTREDLYARLIAAHIVNAAPRRRL